MKTSRTKTYKKKSWQKRAFSILTLVFLLVQTVLSPVAQYVSAENTNVALSFNQTEALEGDTLTATLSDIGEDSGKLTFTVDGGLSIKGIADGQGNIDIAAQQDKTLSFTWKEGSSKTLKVNVAANEKGSSTATLTSENGGTSSVAIQVTAQEEVVSEEATENDEVATSEESTEKAEKANEEEQESGSVATESEKSSDELGVSKEEKSSDELGVSKEEKSSDTTKAVSEDTEEKDSSSKASARDTQTYNHIDILLVAKDITFTLDGKKYSIPGTVIQDTLVVKSGSNTWTGSQFHKEKDPNRNDWEYRLTRISISSAATVDVSCKIELDTSKLSDEELAILKEHLEFDAQGRLTFEGTFDESDNVCGGKGSARGFDFEVSGTELGEYFTTGTIDIIKVDGDTVDSDSPVYLSGATFRLIDSNKKVVVIEGVTDSNGIITTDASGKASFTKVPYGTYTLEEVSPPDGYTLPSPGKWQVKISKDSKTQTVTVKNYTVGSLTIAKNVNGVDDEDNAGTFNFIVLDESGEQVKEGSIVYPGDKSLTFDDLPAGKYIILEEDPSGVYSETGYNYVNTTADVDGNAVTVRSVTKDDTKYMQVAEVAITSGGETTVTYTNTYSQKTGEITVNKTVTGISDDDKGVGEFTFTLLDKDGGTVATEKIDMSQGSSVTFTDVTPGTYTIVEQDPSGAYTGYALTGVQVNGKASDTFSTDDLTVSRGNSQEVTFTNNYSEKAGSITVNKEVNGVSKGLVKEGKFTYTLLDSNGEKVDELTVDMSTATSVTFTNVKPGTYTIVEQDPSGAYTGYALTGVQVNGKASDTFSTDDLTVSRGNSQEVKFTNVYEEKAGDITVTKDVQGVNKGDVKEGQFTFQLMKGEEVVQEKVVDMSKETSVTFEDVTPGTYTIVEKDPSGAYKGYTFSEVKVNGEAVSNPIAEDVKVSRGEGPTVAFTNVYEEKAGDITVTKDVQGVNKGDVKEGQFTFQLMKGEEVVQEKVVDMSKETSVTFEDVTPGTYTIVEKDPSGAYKGYTFSEVKVNGEAVSNPIAEDVKVSRGEGPTVAFTNVYEEKAGDITVTKDVQGVNKGDVKEGQFTFQLMKGEEVVQEKVVDMSKETSVTFEDVTPGTYTIVEKDPSGAYKGYTFSEVKVNGEAVSNPIAEDVKVSRGEGPTVAFTNVYEEKAGDITVTKDVQGVNKGDVKEGQFTFQLMKGEEVVQEKVVDMSKETSVTFEDVTPGTYTIVEKDPSGAYKGYTFSEVKVNGEAVSNPIAGDVTVSRGEGPTVAFTNVYEENVGDITVTKGVQGVNEGDVEEGIFTFQLLNGDEEVVQEKTIDMSKGTSVTFEDVAPGTYSIVEEGADGAYKGYTLTEVQVGGEAVSNPIAEDVKVSRGEGPTVAFTNVYEENAGDITVNKEVTGVNEDDVKEGVFTYNLVSDGEVIQTKEIDMSKETSVTFADVEPGTYTIVELDPSGAYTGYALTGVQVNGEASETFSTGDLIVSRGNSQGVTFTNAYSENVGSITVTKDVTGVNEADMKEGTFTYTLLDSEGKKADELTVDMSITSSVTFTNVKPGTYTIVEQDPSGAYTGYTLTGVEINGEKSEDYTTDSLSVRRGNSQEVAFTNVYEENAGDITVTKDVQGMNEGDVEEGIFTFQLVDADGKVVQEKTIDMSKGTSVTFEDVAPGTYSIVEEGADGAYTGYTLTEVQVGGEAVSNPIAEDVKVSRGEGPTVAFTNVYDENAGDITVTKDVQGVNKGDVEEGIFTFQLVDADGKVVQEKTIDMSKETSVTFEGVAPGIYSIVEEGATDAYKGYTLTDVQVGGEAVSNPVAEDVTVSRGEGPTVAFTNVYEENAGDITVTKGVQGVNEGDVEEGIFTFQLLNGDEEVVQEKTIDMSKGTSVTFEDVAPGTYSIVEQDPSGAYEGYSFKEVKVNGEAMSNPIAEEITVSRGEGPNVAFTNVYEENVGTITINKEVSGVGEDAVKGGQFTFTLLDEEGETVAEQTIDMSKASSVTFENVAPGTYSVAESNAEDAYEGYTFTTVKVNGEEVSNPVAEDLVVSRGNDQEVSFTNVYEENAGSITVNKDVVGVNKDDVEAGQFTFTLLDEEGETVAEQTIDMSKASSVTFEDVIPGTYSVAESNAEDAYEGYTFTTVKVNGDEVSNPVAEELVVSLGNDQDVNFTNVYKENGGSSFSIEKTADKDEVKVGDTITYTITVTNTGEQALTDVRVVDEMVGLDEVIGQLDAGETETFTVTHKAVKADVGELTNIATATVTIDDEEVVQEAKAVVTVKEVQAAVVDDEEPTITKKIVAAVTDFVNPKTGQDVVNIFLALAVFMLAGFGLYVFRRKGHKH